LIAGELFSIKYFLTKKGERIVLKILRSIVLLILFVSSGLLAQQVMLTDEFDSGDGLWTSGWIDNNTATVTVSIDTTSKLSGKNSYKIAVVNGGPEMYRIQRNANLPLVAGYQYTLSFMAVADSDAYINVLFEIAGDPYTKRLNDTVLVTDTPQTFTYTMTATENVPTNQVKLHFGGQMNNNRTIWVDKILVTRIADPTLVSLWGLTPNGKYWPILNDSSTAAGNGSIGGSAPIEGAGWATVRGEFDALQATTDQAVVVTGKIQFIGTAGGGSTYTPLRYALTYSANDTLKNALTDSAYWVRQPSSGYGFHPRTGSGTMSNGNGGAGTVWTINNGNWNSTYSNNGKPISKVLQAPRNAEMVPGTYNFAFSVRAIDDTTNEIKWYLVEENNKYWFGGTAIDTATTTEFNGVAFGVNTGDWTQVNLLSVRAELGNPIDVPAAPWQSYYVDQWGLTPNGKYWPIKNDSSYLVGDATIEGTAPIEGAGWATMRGEFGQDLPLKTDQALIVTGKLEFVGTAGGGSSYTPIRYAMTYSANDTLKNALTDSAYWVRQPSSGYGFHPRTGSGTMSNGNGGAGTVWTINNGNWNSTYSNNGKPISQVVQAPRNAEIVPGTYNFAFSIRKVDDVTNEIKWYLVEVNNKYWFGGTVIDTATSNKFNGIAFGVNTGDWTAFNVLGAKVDYGEIEVPEAPWQDYYVGVGSWGIIGNHTGGFTFVPGDLDGNAGVAGSSPNTNVAAIAGDIGIVQPKPGKALEITGKLVFEGGGFEGASGLRYGLFLSSTAGTIQNAGTDSAKWSGDENASGYLLTPTSGTNAAPNWNGNVPATFGAVVNSTWWSTTGTDNYILSAEKQTPTDAIAGPGTYDFSIKIQPRGNGSNDVAFSLVKSDNSYTFSVAQNDNHDPLVGNAFNGIAFALNSWTGSTTTAMYVQDVKVSLQTITGVEEDANAEIPIQYALDQNYPNPFNPTTTIGFALPMSGDVQLSVYDILGRKVVDLVNSNLPAGYHTVNFDASSLASGVYLYRITAGNFISVKKLMLLK
jgi:hypothetical protein